MNSSSALPKVVVNATWCVPGAVGGSEDYIVRQLLGLPFGAVDLTICAPRGFASAHRELSERYSIEESSHDGVSRPRRVFDEATWLYRQTRNADVVHHGGGTIPFRFRRPTVLTIHDLQYREFPQYIHPIKLAYLKSVMPRSARRADVVAVPTEFVKRTVIEAYGIDGDKVVVVPHGVESTLGDHATSASDLRIKFALGNDPIVVMPAMTHPHKGHFFLLDVMKKHWKSQGVQLILIGAAGSRENEVTARISSGGLDSGVHRLGRVSNEDRDGFLRMAKALVFPSEYEGFGAPVIEAMRVGTPVITSDRACLPEVVGHAGLVLPLDIEAWKDALDIVEGRHDEFVTAGLARVQQFTTEVSGAALIKAYEKAGR